MKKLAQIKSISDILGLGLGSKSKENATVKDDKVIKHNRLENLVYKDKRREVESEFEELEATGEKRLKSIKSLSQDMFNSLYNISPELKEEAELSTMAREFNKTIVEKMMQTDEYPVLKQLTEGKDYESIEGAREFMQNIVENLDELLKDISGEKETLKVMDKMEEQIEQMEENLEEMLEQYNDLQGKGMPTDQLESKMVKVANQLQSKQSQYENLQQIIADNKVKNNNAIEDAIKAAVKQTTDKVEEIKETLDAWGNEGIENAGMQVKKELIEKINKSPKLKQMAKLLGKYREIASREMKNAYIYNRGTKYDVELGNDITNLLTGEYALLASEKTRPFFLQKYNNKSLKQYRKRDPIKKGCGKKIICIDESGSTSGGKNEWAKAITIALMDITMRNKQDFAVIHFSTDIETHEVSAKNFDTDTIIKIAEHFFGGGTDFELPLSKAYELLQQDRYKGADIVFITDGECGVREEFLKAFNEMKKKKKIKVIGVLLDKGEGNVSDYTLKRFTDKIFKTSEMAEDNIAISIIKSAV